MERVSFFLNCTSLRGKVDTMRLSRREFVALSASSAVVCPGFTLAQSYGSEQRLRLAGPVSGIGTLDPALTRDLQVMFIVRQLFRGLLQFGNDMQPMSDLAELIDQSDTLDSFSFRMRDDARFADGRTMTADDVYASFVRALTPETGGGSVGALAAVTYLRDVIGAEELLAGKAEGLSGVVVQDATTLDIRLVAPSATFLTRLASVPTSIVDVSEATNDPVGWWQSPNASGPFVVESIDPELLMLGPNPNYGDATNRLQRIEFRLGLSAINPLNLYQEGAIDLVVNASGEGSKLIDDPASQVEALVQRVSLFATSYIAFGNTTEPLDDVHVRRALQLLVSQDLVADSMFAGTVDAATGLIPNGMLGREWSSSLPPQNFDAARNELALSRFGLEEEVPTISIFAADIEPVAMLRDLAARELAITIETIEVGWEDFLAGLIERRFPAYALYWGADYPDPEAMLGMLFRSDGSDNYAGYVNAGFDAILDRARSEADLEQRASLYEEAQNLLIADAGIIPLYFDRGVTVSRPGVGGLVATPLGVLGLEMVSITP